MEILDMCTYYGRNIYSHNPVIKMTIDIGNLGEITTNHLGDFNTRLLNMLPGLKKHHCSRGYEGGFVDRLKDGTLVSHVTEHIALELQSITGYNVCYGKTRIIKEPSQYYVIYEYVNERCALFSGCAAVEIVAGMVKGQEIPIENILDKLSQIRAESDFGSSTKAIIEEARKRNIPVRRLGSDSLLQLGYGKKMRLIEASLPDTTSCVAVDLVANKQIVKRLLREHLIPTPEGEITDSVDDALNLADVIGYPVVVKPLDANHGQGVTVNIRNQTELRLAYHLAATYAKKIMLEKYIAGRDYRVLVIGNQIAAVGERRPPFVIGDGIHSITELVNQENCNPNRGVDHLEPLTKIRLDSVVKEHLCRKGIKPTDIPLPGECIYLRLNGNLSTGGTSRDCTSSIHPQNAELAIKAASIVGLDVAGVDIMIDDIAHPLTSQNGGIIEINAAPGLRMHLHPSKGQKRNVAADILDIMYPQGTDPSIPIISVTGTNGKTTVTRIIHHVLGLNGKKVGMTCSEGTYIQKNCISKGDNTGPASAQLLLYNQAVEAAVLETARGGIIRRGLGYDLADVGIITNIDNDHLGQDGIETLDDLVFVKSLVIEAIKPSGYAILNADDIMTESILPRVKCRKILFSLNRNNELIANHLRNGEMVVTVEDKQVCVFKHRRKVVLLPISEIPITYNGELTCNIENSLAAIAGLLALAVPVHTIRSGLMSFKPSLANKGRFSFFNMGDFQVMLDYGHNLCAYSSVIQFISTINAERLVGIIGMPGDRLEQSIFDVGRICAGIFSKIIIKEDGDLRGRKPGEVANILYSGVVAGGCNKTNIEIILSETEALQSALKTALPGDLIVLFFEDYAKVLPLLQAGRRIPGLNLTEIPLSNAEQPIAIENGYIYPY